MHRGESKGRETKELKECRGLEIPGEGVLASTYKAERLKENVAGADIPPTSFRLFFCTLGAKHSLTFLAVMCGVLCKESSKQRNVPLTWFPRSFQSGLVLVSHGNKTFVNGRSLLHQSVIVKSPSSQANGTTTLSPRSFVYNTGVIKMLDRFALGSFVIS